MLEGELNLVVFHLEIAVVQYGGEELCVLDLVVKVEDHSLEYALDLLDHCLALQLQPVDHLLLGLHAVANFVYHLDGLLELIQYDLQGDHK